MSHVLNISDETYRAIESLARQRGTTPEALAETLLSEHLAEREAIARQNAEWETGLHEALARAARGDNQVYHTTDEFFAALDQISSEESGG
jgi:predicted transcriptional regulator